MFKSGNLLDHERVRSYRIVFLFPDRLLKMESFGKKILGQVFFSRLGHDFGSGLASESGIDQNHTQNQNHIQNQCGTWKYK